MVPDVATASLGRGIFVTDSRLLANEGRGGVQICTQEYIDGLKAAGVDLEVISWRRPLSLAERARYKLVPNPYHLSPSTAQLAELADAARDADFVFLNQVNLAADAPRLRRAIGVKPRLILLSHGCESTDFLHSIRAIRNGLPLSAQLGWSPSLTVGSILAAESRSRESVDGVVALSAFDTAQESWLGSPKATWVSRIVTPQPLEWMPVAGRFGYVGTLDHTPNLEGLVAVLDELERVDAENVSVEIVGGPPAIGEWLQTRYVHVCYLGGLDDAALLAAAGRWTAFLHPIFYASRGCSTKLAQPMGWGMPVITTEQGRRGYLWSRGSLVERDDPAGFVSELLAMLPNRAIAARSEVEAARDSSPTLDEVGMRLRSFLIACQSGLTQHLG